MPLWSALLHQILKSQPHFVAGLSRSSRSGHDTVIRFRLAFLGDQPFQLGRVGEGEKDRLFHIIAAAPSSVPFTATGRGVGHFCFLLLAPLGGPSLDTEAEAEEGELFGVFHPSSPSVGWSRRQKRSACSLTFAASGR